MTTSFKLNLFICLVTLSTLLTAQTQKPSLTVLNIDVHGIYISSSAMGNLVRTEIEKLDTFAITDKYDMNYIVEQKKFPSILYTDTNNLKINYRVVKTSKSLNYNYAGKDTLELIEKFNTVSKAEKNREFVNNCFGKLCMVEIGETINCDKMLGGNIDLYGKTMVVTLRLVDVKTKTIERTYVKEFLNLPDEIQSIINVSVREMFGYPNDKNTVAKLTQRFQYDNAINNPHKTRLRLDGPRMGCVSYSGSIYNRIAESKSTGGFDAFPVMFQFGYQFEKQYLNEGKVQALFEFIPLVTGLDQGLFIPSISVLHGVRSNINGWEFAFGPTFNYLPMADGYYDDNNVWRLRGYWDSDPLNAGKQNPFEIISRLDSRGDLKLHTGFVLAAGRTFKSGKLNIPVNAFAIPGRDGWRFGLSFGFNSKNK